MVFPYNHSTPPKRQATPQIMSINDVAVPKGSTVLVTGVNGFLGSHVADQFLRNGYKVRGTVRDVAKSGWVRETFARLHGPDGFDLVEVPAMEADGAFDEVAKGEGWTIDTGMMRRLIRHLQVPVSSFTQPPS